MALRAGATGVDPAAVLGEQLVKAGQLDAAGAKRANGDHREAGIRLLYVPVPYGKD